MSKAKFHEAFAFFVKTFIGPACLSFPLAFERSGVLLGSGMLIATAAVVFWNLRILVLNKILLEAKGRTITTYADLMECALGPVARSVLEVAVNIQQLGICAVCE